MTCSGANGRVTDGSQGHNITLDGEWCAGATSFGLWAVGVASPICTFKEKTKLHSSAYIKNLNYEMFGIYHCSYFC